MVPGSVAVAHHQHTQGGAHADQNEAFFLSGLVLVFDQNAPVVVERRLRLFERDAVLALVLGALGRVPLEAEHGLQYNYVVMACQLAAQQGAAADRAPLAPVGSW